MLALLEATERRGDQLHVALPVVCELAWVLQGRHYGYDRPSIAAVLERLLDTGVFAIQDRDIVRQALGDYRDGRAHLADYLIGRQNRAAGCVDTLTFDERLASESGFSAPE